MISKLDGHKVMVGSGIGAFLALAGIGVMDLSNETVGVSNTTTETVNTVRPTPTVSPTETRGLENGDVKTEGLGTIDQADSRIYEAFIADNEIEVIVPSNGCTYKTSFNPLVLPEGNSYTVIFRRLEADPCRALMPDGTSLFYTFAELDIPEGSEVQIMNPRRAYE